MFISDFIFKKISNFSIESYQQQRFMLLCTESSHFLRCDFLGVDVEVVKSFKSHEDNQIPAFCDYTKVYPSGLKNNQIFALFKTKLIHEKYAKRHGRIKFYELENIVLCRYYKWLRIGLPFKVISIQPKDEIKIDYSLLNCLPNQTDCPSFEPASDFVHRALGHLSNKELVDFYNNLLCETHDAERQVYLLSLHKMFLHRLNKSPMTVIDGKQLSLSHELCYIESLDTYYRPNWN